MTPQMTIEPSAAALAWLAGKHVPNGSSGFTWELCGVFTGDGAEDRAVAECDSIDYFVACFPLNTPAPKDTTAFPICYYPKRIAPEVQPC